MKQTENIDELINQYSSELLDFAKINNHMYGDYSSDDAQENESDSAYEEDFTEQTLTNEKTAENMQTSEKALTQEKTKEAYSEENFLLREENLFFPRTLPEEEFETTEEETEEKETDNPLENPESFAYFTGRVFAAEGALPVDGAKVVVKKDGEIYAYLLTDGSGETKTVKLEAYPKENSLEPNGTNKQMIYTADIYAEGFESKRNLLIEATGGSVVVLQQFMVPVQQGG